MPPTANVNKLPLKFHQRALGQSFGSSWEIKFLNAWRQHHALIKHEERLEAQGSLTISAAKLQLSNRFGRPSAIIRWFVPSRNCNKAAWKFWVRSTVQYIFRLEIHSFIIRLTSGRCRIHSTVHVPLKCSIIWPQNMQAYLLRPVRYKQHHAFLFPRLNALPDMSTTRRCRHTSWTRSANILIQISNRKNLDGYFQWKQKSKMLTGRDMLAI